MLLPIAIYLRLAGVINYRILIRICSGRTRNPASMIAAKLRPLYGERAKRRQIEALKRGNVNRHGGESPIEEKIPQLRKTQARDEAGKAAGVNGRYVDMAKPSSP